MVQEALTGEKIAVTDNGLPLIIKFENTIETDSFIDWYKRHAEFLETKIHDNGAVLFKNIGIGELGDFDYIMKNIAGTPLRYVDGFSPRTKLSSSTYTSTEYDKDFFITLHNELSYSAKWPAKIFFCCIIPSETGGQTAIADGRKILRRMRPELLAEMKQKGVKYVRNLHGGGGAGPSWQQTYETESRADVEKFCTENNIEFSWKEDGGIKLTQFRPAVIDHPVTGETVWFNQVDQFHPSHLDKDIYEMLMLMYSREEDLPMYGAFGDGSVLSEAAVKEIQDTVAKEIVLNTWEKGDLLMVDNILVCHGRMPFTGDRKILVSMS
ncbi:TauD/TfdA family dioxygenase [Chryseolinea lacunae]|uniref:TauD/TfdA family dioxygenase n=1 Tax=Chryseolinea lacunae TaxID=2801331 RepID=A0ABS1KV21_9BACT|nr:TauD/TfdA family dioxygenase [Chryseolinea lacunae]MBL0743067.1 TauD/TfdA family dioxygenase [Chryseolinea lacunae]